MTSFPRPREEDTGMATTSQAIDQGATGTPLLEDTIGANLEATMARHGDREAFVVRTPGRALSPIFASDRASGGEVRIA